MAKLMSASDIEKMRAAGTLAGETLKYAGTLVKEGVSTGEINDKVHKYITDHNAYPSPLNYRGFPKSVCTSVNEVICHGIPSESHILKKGDIINIDVTVTLDGFYGDTSRTFYVGEESEAPEQSQLVKKVAEESLARAICVLKHGCRVGDIGHAIQTYAEAEGCAVVRDFVGHGIGNEFHLPPSITHFGNQKPGQSWFEACVSLLSP